MENLDSLTPLDKILLISRLANSIGINTVKLTSVICGDKLSLANEAAIGMCNNHMDHVLNGEFNTNGEMSIEFLTYL